MVGHPNCFLGVTQSPLCELPKQVNHHVINPAVEEEAEELQVRDVLSLVFKLLAEHQEFGIGRGTAIKMVDNGGVRCRPVEGPMALCAVSRWDSHVWYGDSE